MRPLWAEVDLGAFRRNVRRFRARVGRAKVLFVCKADGYGHGAVPAAKAALAAGVSWLGVTSVEEGKVLREQGIKAPVLVLGSLFPFESLKAAAALDLTPTVASRDAAQALDAAGRALGRRLACHVKVETGMGRIGVGAAEAVRLFERLAESRGARLEGAYTHLSSADTDRAFTREQLVRFRAALDAAKDRRIRIPLRHAANSEAALRYPESRFDLVRPGLALYGLMDGFEPVMALKARIVFVKKVPAGSSIGYGRTYRTFRASRIATLPGGYADGVRRGLSNAGHVLVGGRRCPIVGTVTMDMTMVDVTGVPGARVGDEAVFFGRQGRAVLPAAEVAGRLGTIPYEVVCGVAARVPRVHLA